MNYAWFELNKIRKTLRQVQQVVAACSGELFPIIDADVIEY